MTNTRKPQGWEDISGTEDRQWWRKEAYPFLLYVEERPQPGEDKPLWDFQVRHVNARPGSYEHQGYRVARASAIKAAERYVTKFHERARKAGLE